MEIAILTSPHFLQPCYECLKAGGNNVNYAVLIESRGGGTDNQTPESVNKISVEESIDLYHNGKIDAIVVDYPRHSGFDREKMNYFIRNFKLNRVENLYMLVNYPVGSFYATSLLKLNSDKFYLEYIETHIVDYCNLNCRSCGHYASLFSKNDIYPLEEFRRDIRSLSHHIDLAVLRLMGGEPFLAQNFDEYIRIAREYFPRTMIVIVTNGLLIPKVEEKIFRAIRECRVVVEITRYPPTSKMIDKIHQTLTERGITHFFGAPVDRFMLRFIRGKEKFDPNRSMAICESRYCHFLRHGKIYKCPGDALIYKYQETFPGNFNMPENMGVDIFAENFLELLQQLTVHTIRLCETCPTSKPTEPWQIENNPTAEDWIS